MSDAGWLVVISVALVMAAVPAAVWLARRAYPDPGDPSRADELVKAYEADAWAAADLARLALTDEGIECRVMELAAHDLPVGYGSVAPRPLFQVFVRAADLERADDVIRRVEADQETDQV